MGTLDSKSDQSSNDYSVNGQQRAKALEAENKHPTSILLPSGTSQGAHGLLSVLTRALLPSRSPHMEVLFLKGAIPKAALLKALPL